MLAWTRLPSLVRLLPWARLLSLMPLLVWTRSPALDLPWTGSSSLVPLLTWTRVSSLLESSRGDAVDEGAMEPVGAASRGDAVDEIVVAGAAVDEVAVAGAAVNDVVVSSLVPLQAWTRLTSLVRLLPWRGRRRWCCRGRGRHRWCCRGRGRRRVVVVVEVAVAAGQLQLVAV